MQTKKDLSGLRFGRLFVICHSVQKNKNHYWRCKCDCGSIKDISGNNLVSGKTQSCGCKWKQRIAFGNKKHGMAYTRIYRIWAGMVDRCNRTNSSNYKNYGAKGISVCAEWINFEPFYEWARINGYAENLTIDRIDNSLGYCPENCRWVTQAEQVRNTTRNVVKRQDVVLIKNMLANGTQQKQIAEFFGCGKHIISQIKLNKTWRDV